MRKKYIVGLLVLLCGILMCVSGAHASEDDVIANDASGIPDPELYQSALKAVRYKRTEDTYTEEEYRKETFTRQEAERVRELHVMDGGVRDLTGIECFCNLERLIVEDGYNINANEFTSLKPLQGLKLLKELEIDRSWNLESLAGIEGLTGLERLRVTRTGLKSLAGIEGLVRLRELDLRQSGLKSLAGIEGLTDLRMLLVDYGRLESLAGIEGLTDLERLEASNNRLKSIREIRSLKRLERLCLGGNRLEEAREIRHLKSLRWLSLEDNRLTDIDGIKNLRYLTDIIASNNRLVRLPKMKWGPYEMLAFRGNRLSKGELDAKLKKSRLADGWFAQSWLTDLAMFQDNYRIRLSSPRSLKKITKNTRKITGRIKRSGPYQGEIYVSVNDEESRWNNVRVKVDADGKIIPVKGKKNGSLKNSLVSVQPDGSFVIKQAMTRIYREGTSVAALQRQLNKGVEMFFEIYIYSEGTKRLDCVKSVLITEKADFDIGYEWDN